MEGTLIEFKDFSFYLRLYTEVPEELNPDMRYAFVRSGSPADISLAARTIWAAMMKYHPVDLSLLDFGGLQVYEVVVEVEDAA